MPLTTSPKPTESAAAYWNRVLAPFKQSSTRKAIFQVLNTLIPFVALWIAMLYSLRVSYALTLLLSVPTAGLLVRLFVLHHDCGHGSFFPSRRANHVLGFLLGVLVLTPYRYWQRTHAIHHATSGNLDRREFGDVRTLTVREYLARPWWRRLGYRLYRNPFVLLVAGPAFQFLIKHRLPLDAPRSWRKEWASVVWTNLASAGVVVALIYAVGLSRFLLIQIPIFLISGAIGVWLFYVQHQFEDTYWERRKEWDFHLASIEGSSLYDLPAIAHWFTGNIGYHHIHHLSSKIPNYRLRECMRETPDLQHVTRVGFLSSLRCLGLKLWSEETSRLVGFQHLRKLRA